MDDVFPFSHEKAIFLSVLHCLDLDDDFSATNAKIVLIDEDSTRADSNERMIHGEEHATRAEEQELSRREQLYRRWQQDCYPSLLETFKGKLRKITEREDDWDGKGSKKPSSRVLYQAHNSLEYFLYSVVNSGRLWYAPFVSSNEDGHITIQWNHGDHELHIEIGEEETEYIKVWGVNIEHEMHLNILKDKGFLSLWDWLNE